MVNKDERREKEKGKKRVKKNNEKGD